MSGIHYSVIGPGAGRSNFFSFFFSPSIIVLPLASYLCAICDEKRGRPILKVLTLFVRSTRVGCIPGYLSRDLVPPAFVDQHAANLVVMIRLSSARSLDVTLPGDRRLCTMLDFQPFNPFR